MRNLTFALLGTTVLAMPAFAAPEVVTSIKPVHSLVAAVMEGVGTPHLIVDGAASPHTFALSPSHAGALQNADVVFWVGHDLEVFLEGPLETLADNAKVVSLDEVSGLDKLPFREGGAFEAHDHEAHDDHEHDEDHDEHEDHDHGDEDHDHDHEGEDHDHEGHDHGETDPHLWLDPVNAKAMVHAIEHALAEADPENAATYEENAQRTEAALDALIAEVGTIVAPVTEQPFIVFHDAYQYFESRFGMQAAGTITVNPETAPGAQRIAEIQGKIKELGATCVFAEPQFEPRVISVVTEGSDARSGVLDPLGADLENGPNLYPELIRKLATSFADCLKD